MLNSLTLVFEMPPSTNGLYATVGRKRVKSKRYREWIDLAGWQLLGQEKQRFEGRVDLTFRFGPRIANADCSNRIKPAEDLLVRHRIIQDDKHVRRVSAEWADDVRGCEVTITEVEQ